MRDSVKLILGTMTFGEQVFGDDVVSMIKVFRDEGYDELDTAFVYNNGKSERFIGDALKVLFDKEIKIATKVNPRITGKLDGDAVNYQFNESSARMKVDSFDILYLHFPDFYTPVESALKACADLYEQGKIKEFGLSNFPAWLVADVYYKCKINGWMLPTVYEGLYNLLSRKAENELDKALDEYGIRFYAYNPLAGGLLTDKYSQYDQKPIEGRFTYRPNYQNRYWLNSYFEAVNIIKEECQRQKLNIVEVAYRWLAYHSMLKGKRGDGIIIGASRLSQLEQNMATIKKGPLNDDMIDVINQAWEISRKDAPEYFRFYK